MKARRGVKATLPPAPPAPPAEVETEGELPGGLVPHLDGLAPREVRALMTPRIFRSLMRAKAIEHLGVPLAVLDGTARQTDYQFDRTLGQWVSVERGPSIDERLRAWVEVAKLGNSGHLEVEGDGAPRGVVLIPVAQVIPQKG